mmetsp:Transcript_14986/g.23032  ORF Transcript_14986/g.23032 Transcript_14986/m.23032 type:complete len:355 (-) Transcript_14986:7-1071(-)
MSYRPFSIAIILLGCFACFLVIDYDFRRFLPQLDRHLVRKETEDEKPPHIVAQMGALLLEDQERIWEFTPDENRPVMHTFYTPLGGNHDQISRHDASILATWKHAWYQAGWNPRVLRLEDAKKYPKFDEMYDAVNSMKYNKYETWCYMRYFAMAAIGGGYMSDYDTIPLNFIAEKKYRELPNNGNFTTFSYHIPALLSASDSEWGRVGQRLVEEGVKRNNIPVTFSDMLALQRLLGKKEVIAAGPKVYGIFPKGFQKKDGKLYCNILSLYRAIHVSHESLYREKRPINLRPEIMADIMQQYHTDCGSPEFYQSFTQALHLAKSGSNDLETQLRRKAEAPLVDRRTVEQKSNSVI